MNVVFIGDSLTSGENNNFKSFANYYAKSHPEHRVDIFGVSGACMGNYSIYPVKENMFDICYTLCNDSDLVANADRIYLEYSINDTTAVAASYVNLNQVYITIAKTVDMLKQTNAKVEIYFILPFDCFDNDIDIFANYHIEYLNNDYLSAYTYKIDKTTWVNSYNSLVQFIKNTFNIIFINDIIDYWSYLDPDQIHLTDEGYKTFGNKL